MSVTIFGIHLHLDPVAFTLPIGSGWRVYWYGIIIATGFLLALLYAMKNAGRFSIDVDRMMDVVLVTTPLAVLGARAYYILFDKDSSFKDFFDFANSGFSGLAIYGGVIVAFSVGFLMCKLRKVKILDMFDLAATGFLIGQGIGRWGNFVNQEAFGRPTGSSWWGMTSANVSDDFAKNGFAPDALAHPCFLYESVWCIAGFFILNHFGKKRKFSGQILLMYGVWYGFGRGFIELLRTDSLMIGAFRVSSLLSFILCITSVILLIVLLRKYAAKSVEGDYNVQFEEHSDSEMELKEESDPSAESVLAEPDEHDADETPVDEATESTAEVCDESAAEEPTESVPDETADTKTPENKPIEPMNDEETENESTD